MQPNPKQWEKKVPLSSFISQFYCIYRELLVVTYMHLSANCGVTGDVMVFKQQYTGVLFSGP